MIIRLVQSNDGSDILYRSLQEIGILLTPPCSDFDVIMTNYNNIMFITRQLQQYCYYLLWPLQVIRPIKENAAAVDIMRYYHNGRNNDGNNKILYITKHNRSRMQTGLIAVWPNKYCIISLYSDGVNRSRRIRNISL